ncbi:MAG: methyltransferase domain-containing protein [SAR202 cluster bacterium]|nr:methyltransferase domain-containing protein [SAR202 cluster bacterium]
MPDYSGFTTLHEQGWKGHEAQNFAWQDPTNPQKQRLALAALKSLGPPHSVRVLDYGCGNGILTQFFHGRGHPTVGIDISPTVIASNCLRIPEATFQLVPSDAPAPFDDASFDAIFCSEVVEHVYDTNFLFGEFSRLLKPGGLLLLTTPYHGVIKNLIVVTFYFERHFDPTWQHIRFFTRKSLSRVCRAHGLIPKRWWHVGRVWPVPKSFFLVCRKESPPVLPAGRATE